MPEQTATTIVTSIMAPGLKARAWICDIWGVLHNGVAAFQPAVDACTKFRADGGYVILVTNAPRPANGVIKQLAGLGISPEAYDRVLTSGDVTREILGTWGAQPTLHIGPERDLTLFDDLAITLTNAARAERVLCSGLYDDTTETAEHYRTTLQELAARSVPMLCANPDIKVDRGGRIIYCAGAVAQLYEEMGGKVAYAGKPYSPIYDAARQMIADIAGRTIEATDILAIGDGVHTDIPGGLAHGMRTVYVASAIYLHEPMTPPALEKLFPDRNQRPQFAMEALA